MARTAMSMSSGGKISEHLSVGLLARAVPRQLIREVLAEQKLESQRVRDLPAEVVVYYTIALGLFMAVSTREVLRCLVEGLEWLGKLGSVRIAGKAAISQARTRLGAAPLRELWNRVAKPVAAAESPGVFAGGLRVVVLDGSTLDVPDTQANDKFYGRQLLERASGRRAVFPQLRFVALAEAGTHTLFRATMGPYRANEMELAQELFKNLDPSMLCVADRLYSTYPLWQKATKTGAQLLWRARQNMVLPVEELLADGSYLSSLYPSSKARSRRRKALPVRVIEYRLDRSGAPSQLDHSDTLYRLITTVLDPKLLAAQQLAALYAQRWEIEGAFDEIKTHLRGGQVVLRSKTPDLVQQEFYGLLLAHWAVRLLMQEAADREKIDPDQLSFIHSIQVIRRKLASSPTIPPSPPHVQRQLFLPIVQK
jgi:Insertion element 4 transposase N-terminal/Transposase DDE domain